MRIRQCRIENFGKISDAVFDFTDGANVICQENGWGKSTLASFIRIMFFGFENANRQDKLINERKRYLPWQGGIYGGSITFEADGTEYIMRRVFGRKEKDDEFELREAATNLPSDAYTSNIGEELFQIDGASFRRTVFLSQQDCEAGSTDAIHAKLGNLVENTDDINNFQTVYDRLKDRTNKMTPSRKTGSLNKEKTMIADMENALREEETMNRSIREVEERREDQLEKRKNLDKEIQEWQNRQAKLSESLDLGMKKKEYENHQTACEQAKRELSSCRQAFPDPGHIPSSDQVEDWQERDRQCGEYRREMSENWLSDEEKNTYERMKRQLKDQIPTEEDMETMEAAWGECSELRIELLAGQLTPAEEKEWETLMERYPDGVPDVTEIQHIRDKWEEAKRRQEGLTAKRVALAAIEKVSDSHKAPSYVPLFVMGLLALAVGITIGYLFDVLLGIAAGVVVGIIPAGAFFLIRKAGVSKEEEEGEDNHTQLQLAKEIAEDEETIQRDKEHVIAFLNKYGCLPQEETVLPELGMLSADGMKYQNLSARKQFMDGGEKRLRYETLHQTLSDFMKLYYEEDIPEGRWASQLSTLKEQIRNFHRWEPKAAAYGEAKQKYDNERYELLDELRSYGFSERDSMRTLLQQIRDMVNRYTSAKAVYDKAQEVLSAFEKINDIEQIRKAQELEDEDSLAQMNTRLTACREERDAVTELIDSYDKQLQDYQEQLDELLVQKVELRERKEKYQEDLKKYQLLLQTMDYLQRAKDNLTARYIGPVQNGFERYYQLISGQEADGYQFDASTKLTVDELGMPRETRFFSEGCRDLAGICTRMALIDAMYEGEKPFVIMDDPFVNLDDAKTEKALQFLQEISKEYQVIYFTCSGSRVGKNVSLPN